MNYAQGPFCYNPDNHSIFIVGNGNQRAIAEFPVPELSKAQEVVDLNMSQTPLQVFAASIDRAPDNSDDLNVVGGMALFDGPFGKELLINAYNYYDAPADNVQTTMVMRNAYDLANSAVQGFWGFDARAHAARWLSPVPREWQDLVGGSYIAGASTGDPIAGRWPIGPSAFAFDPADIIGNNSVPNPIQTVTLLDYDLKNGIGGVQDDLMNDSRTNDLWTRMSRAIYGFIVPGTRTYLTIGATAGTRDGLCYKHCIPDNGTSSGGNHARDTSDYDFAYWLFDVNDMLRVKAGEIEPYEVMTYEYGYIEKPLNVTSKKIDGASYDPGSGLLYVAFEAADHDQGRYSNPPVIGAYSFNVPGAPMAVTSVCTKKFRLSVFPNPLSSATRIILDPKKNETVKSIQIFDIKGKKVKSLVAMASVTWDGTDNTGNKVTAGVYLVQIRTGNRVLTKRVTLVR
jgi:hypothetical protein